MPTVYVVTDGDYSDYHIVGIYSTRELAERAQALFAADSVDEYPVDEMPSAPPGLSAWSVTMNRHGDSLDVHQIPISNIDGAAGDWEPGHNGWATTRCLAADQPHALKIANERRLMAIASNDWRVLSEGRKDPQPTLSAAERSSVTLSPSGGFVPQILPYSSVLAEIEAAEHADREREN